MGLRGADHLRATSAMSANVHERCRATAEEFGMPGNYVAGANIAGFTRVADAVLELGLI